MFNSEFSEKIALISPAELLAQWEGVAIIVSKKPVGQFVQRFQLRNGIGFLGMIIMVVLFSAAVKHLVTQKSWVSVLLFPWLYVCGSSVFDSGHIFAPINQDFLAWQSQVQASENFPRSISLEEFFIYNTGDDVVVDSRMTQDYEKIHLRGAINIPPTISLTDFKFRTAKLSKSAPIVIYCSNIGCGFSEIIAHRFRSQGFEDICVFPPGLVALRDHGFKLDRRGD